MGRELAARTWELVEDGIAVWCRCEKGRFCPENQTLLMPESSDRIEAQIWGEINALRQEYQVPRKRVSFYRVLRDTPRPERRLLLRGRGKEEVGLAEAQGGRAWAEADSGRTTFFVRLPLRQTAAPGEAPEATEEGEAAAG